MAGVLSVANDSTHLGNDHERYRHIDCRDEIQLRRPLKENANVLVATSRHSGCDADFRKPIVRLETAKGRHKVLDLASRRGFAGFEVALNAKSGEEGQHDLRNCGRWDSGLFRLDVHGEKALQ